MIEHLLNFEIHVHKMTNNSVISNILHILRKRGYKKKPPRRLFSLEEINHLYNLLILNVQRVIMALYNQMVVLRL